MNRPTRVVVVLALLAAAFLAGTWWSQRPLSSSSVVHAAPRYACPMHPQYSSDHQGDCPSCGMRLEPLSTEAGGAAAESVPMPAGAVRVSTERQQTIGVRLGVVERISGTRTLRTTGRVAPNENAVYPLVAGAEGWVRDVRGATSGSLVKKDDVLLSFYSPEFITAQQSYYSGIDTLGRVATEQIQAHNPTRVVDGVERLANTLRNLGVSETQLADMRANHELRQYLQLVAPVSGFVLARNAAVGLRFDRGFEFYRIADLRQVWILADVYENQAPFVRAGATALITSQDRGRTFEGRVSRTEPTFDEATRTLKVRLETENPGLVLKPGMFVNVEFAVDVPPALAVPADAIIDSGLRRTVFVDLGNGYFEPRAVETGWRLSDQVEITAGLMAGERIVISGTFLMDSESRMKTAVRRVAAPAAKDPICGMDVDEARARAAGRVSTHDNVTYYFCADACKHEFDAQPAKYARGR